LKIISEEMSVRKEVAVTAQMLRGRLRREDLFSMGLYEGSKEDKEEENRKWKVEGKEAE
jgi:hypothetical protein